jgi:hypothetical protein
VLHFKLQLLLLVYSGHLLNLLHRGRVHILDLLLDKCFLAQTRLLNLLLAFAGPLLDGALLLGVQLLKQFLVLLL